MRRPLPVLVLTAISTLLIAVAVPTGAMAANILANPGFESGLSGWTCSATSGAAVVTSPVHGGSGALSATPASQDTARCQQTITVRPSSSYTLSAWVRGAYIFLGATGTGTTDPQTWAAPGAAWAQLTSSFTTGSTT